MSNNDSLDEETKRLLAEVDADAQSSTNDSKESIKKTTKKEGYEEYEENDSDPLTDKTMDDKEW